MLCSIIVILIANVAGDEVSVNVPLDKGVMVLGDDTLQSVLDSNSLVLVDFYAPWCKHCQKLELEFATAAWMISEAKSEAQKAKFAKVDAIAHTDLAKQFNITRYPTLIFFKNGIAKPFTGGSNADSIYQWVKKKSEDPVKIIDTKEDMNELLTKPDVAVLGFFKDLESDEAQAYIEAADENMVVPFGITLRPEVFQLFRVVDESEVIILKKFDDGMNRMDGKITAEAITTFVDKNSQPFVMEFKPETSKKIFQGFQAFPTFLIFLSSNTGDSGENIEIVKKVAKENVGDIKFVSVDAGIEDNLKLMEFLGVTNKDLPTFRLTAHTDDLIKYKPASEEITEANISAFVMAFKTGELKPHLNTQELPEDWDAQPVKILVASNFDEVVSDNSKNVFVEFYAPWCGHCKQVAPVWDKLGEQFDDSEKVVIAKMDLTANQLETLQVKGFPTFKLFKAGDNAGVDYTGPRNLEAFADFLKENIDLNGKDEL